MIPTNCCNAAGDHNGNKNSYVMREVANNSISFTNIVRPLNRLLGRKP
jgi:hypothetical protein